MSAYPCDDCGRETCATLKPSRDAETDLSAEIDCLRFQLESTRASERAAVERADKERALSDALAGALESVRAWQRWCVQPTLLTDRDREIVAGFRRAGIDPHNLTRALVDPALATYDQSRAARAKDPAHE